MAKSSSTKTAKKPARKAPTRKKTATKKKVTKKVTKRFTKKTVKKKAPAKKPSRATSAPKKTAKKVVKKTAKKSSAKKKAVTKTVSKKTVIKKTVLKKKTTKETVVKKIVKKKPTPKKVTKKKAPVAKPKPVKIALEDMTLEQLMEQDWTIPKLRRIKSGLSRKQVSDYRDMLLEKRAEIIGDVQGMERSRSASLDDNSHMPLHMADVGSDMFDQEFTLGLIESERRMLGEITEALHRIEDKFYGVCMASGQPIGDARLEFKPWAKYCIEVARLREKRGL